MAYFFVTLQVLYGVNIIQRGRLVHKTQIINDCFNLNMIYRHLI